MHWPGDKNSTIPNEYPSVCAIFFFSKSSD